MISAEALPVRAATFTAPRIWHSLCRMLWIQLLRISFRSKHARLQIQRAATATTLPMAVFSSVRLGVSPEVNALATLFLGLVSILVALASLLMARAEQRRTLA